jgi:hypothetical protein
LVLWCICCLRLWLIDWLLTYFPGESRRTSGQLLLTQQRKDLCRHVNIGKSVQTWSTKATRGYNCKTIRLPGNLCKIYEYSVLKQNTTMRYNVTPNLLQHFVDSNWLSASHSCIHKVKCE